MEEHVKLVSDADDAIEESEVIEHDDDPEIFKRKSSHVLKENESFFSDNYN